MSIVTRLWLAIVVAIAVVLSIGAFLRVRVEQDLLMDATLRDRQFFGQALRAALAASADPAASARALVDDERLKQGHIDVSLDPRGRAPDWLASTTDEQRAAFARGDIVVAAARRRIRTLVPVVHAPGQLVIELDEPQDVHAAVERLALIAALIQAIALIVLAGTVSLIVVRALLARPLAALAQHAKRIGAGDLEARTKISGVDDVGILASEMNAMAERLSVARTALREAETERVSLQETLRHGDRLRTVGQLAAALAHELGTPINTVLGHAKIIEKRTEDEALAKGARIIAEQAQRMADLIRELLDFGRKKTGERKEHLVDVLVQKTWALLEPIARKSGAEFELASDGSAKVRVDSGQLLQVFSNLVMNAIQAMPEGGVVRATVTRLEARSLEVPTDVPSAKEFVRISFIDRGVGVDPEDIAHVFEPFFTRKNAGEGTGLGLSVADGIVRAHGGWMQIESELRSGTTVHVYLPSADQ
ncbi:MAG: HAMP domain-containing protein [Myxococcales bacterium]|nr:HAMP domain-containing protein [Myxococcales bacterium]